MEKMLELDLKRIKSKIFSISFFIGIEILHLIVIPFGAIINLRWAYGMSSILNAVLVAGLFYLLTIYIEDSKYKLIYNKIRYHPIKANDFYKSKFIIIGVFSIFQTLFSVVCFILGSLMNMQSITLQTVLNPMVIICTTILITSGFAIIFSGKSVYSVMLIFIPVAGIMVSIDWLMAITEEENLYKILLVLVSVLILYVCCYICSMLVEKID